jgi:outer membrane protein TolC
MSRSITNIIATLFIISSFVLSADKVMTWQDCAAAAKTNNKELQIYREKIAATVLQKNITETTARPQLSAGLSIGESASAESGAKDPGLFDQDNISQSKSLSLSGKQLLYDWDKTSQNIAAATEKIRNQQYNYEINEANVRLNLRQYFCEVLRSQEMIGLSKEIAARRQQQYELVKLRYNAGLEHKGALLTAEANLRQAESQEEQEQRGRKINLKKLDYLIGTTNNGYYAVTANLALQSDLDNTPDFAQLMESTPVLKEVVSRRLQNKYSVASAKADYLPEAYLSASFGKNFNTKDNDTVQNDSWSIGASLSFDLYDGNKKGLTTEAAESDLKQTELEMEQNRREIVLTMQETWNELKNAAADIAVKKIFLHAAEERATIANAQYSSGLISFDDWITIEDNLVSAQKSFLNSQLDSLVQEAKWTNAKGGMLDEK